MPISVCRNSVGTALLALLAALPALAQSPSPGASSSELYGDRQLGHFGDPGSGYFGNPSVGEFRRYDYSRSQEGTVPLAPATPVAPSVSVAPAPYITLKRPRDVAPAPSDQATTSPSAPP